MKTPTDHQTQELPTFAVGNPPCFDLDETAAWPKPDPLEAKPEPEPVTQRLKTWAVRMLETKL